MQRVGQQLLEWLHNLPGMAAYRVTGDGSEFISIYRNPFLLEWKVGGVDNEVKRWVGYPIFRSRVCFLCPVSYFKVWGFFLSAT